MNQMEKKQQQKTNPQPSTSCEVPVKLNIPSIQEVFEHQKVGTSPSFLGVPSKAIRKPSIPALKKVNPAILTLAYKTSY